jgi:MFS family permease
MGLLPYGVVAEQPFKTEKKAREDPPNNREEASVNRRSNLTIRLLSAFAAANAFAAGTVSTHQVAYLQDIGFEPLAAAVSISLLAAFQSLGSLTFGVLALRYHIRYLAGSAFVAQLIALMILMTTTDLAFIYFYAALFGLSTGALVAALPTFVGVYFDRGRYARVLGIVFPFQVIAQAAAAASAGAIFDATASYANAFAIAIFVSILGLISVLCARPPK